MASKGQLASRAVWHSGIGPLLTQRRRQWSGVLVLTYHRVLPPPGPRYLGEVWSTTPERFEEQLDQLTASCDVVGTAAVPRLRNTPGRYVAITFDDGYRDNYEHAFPLLRDRGLPATLFLTTGVLDGVAMPWWDELAWLHAGIRPDSGACLGSLREVIDRYRRSTPVQARMLLTELAAASTRDPLTQADIRDEWITWDMAREMDAGGIDIEAHTIHHPLLSRLSPDEQFAEISGSADRIEEEIGRRPHAFAYPVGQRTAFDDQAKIAARRAGITEAYSLYGGPTTATGEWDPYDIRRVGVGLHHDRARFGALLALPSIFGRTSGEARRASTDLPTPVVDRDELPRPRPVRPSPTPEGRLRVVTLVDRLVDGGAERLAFQLMRDLDPERFERVLCATAAGDPDHATPGTETGRWVEELDDAGVRILGLDRERRSDWRGWAPLLRELRRTDVLHSHMFESNVVASVLGRAMRVPVVIGHEHALVHSGGRWQPAIDRRIVSRSAATLIAPSRAVRDRLVGPDRVPGDRVVVLPNGVESRVPTPGRNLRAELGIPADAPVVGSVGGLRAVKRFDVLIAAAERVRHDHPGVRVLIAGGGPERERLEAAIAERGLRETVHLLGPRDDVPDVLAALDVAVTCSDAEASPLSVMEYMGAGLPTVATRVGGIPELIGHGRHGLLVPRDDPRALATAVGGLLSDPQRRLRMGKAAEARRRAEFDLQVMVQRLEGLYERLYVARRPRRGR